MGYPHGVTVRLIPRVAGGVVDGFEEPDSFGAGADMVGCAVAPGAPVDEPFQQGRPDGDAVECTVYVPAAEVPVPAPAKRDRLDIPGRGVLDVLDTPADWGVNPFTGRRAGLVVLCGRFDG